MVYICVICMLKETPLRSLHGEARKLLEAIVSPVVDLHPLRHTELLGCESCLRLLETLLSFQKTALVGLYNLLNLPYYKQQQQIFITNRFQPPVEQSVVTARVPPCPPLQPLSAPAPAAAGPSSNPTPPSFQIVRRRLRLCPPVETAAGPRTPVMGPTTTVTPTLLVTPLMRASAEVVGQPAPALPGPSSEHNEGASEDPLLVPIKTEHEVPLEIDFKMEIEPEPDTMREQLTHEVDIKMEAEDPAGSPSATDSASDFEDDIPLTTVMKRDNNDEDQATRELATPDEPLITTFTHTRRPTREYRGPAPPDDIEEALRTLPKLPKLAPRPPPVAGAARAPPAAMSTLTRRPGPPISQLEASLQAMAGQLPSFSHSVAEVAGRAPSSAAPERPPDPPDQPLEASLQAMAGQLPSFSHSVAEVAGRAPSSAAPERPPDPPDQPLEASLQAMAGQLPSFSHSVAEVAGRAPSSAAPERPPDPPDQPSAPQSWYVRVLPDAEVAAARAAARAAPGFAAARYKCRACLAAFRCETGKALHDKTHHPFADGRYQCPTCGHREGSADAWRAHVRSHATRYCCCYCPFTTGDIADIRQHYCEPKLQQWENTNFVKGLFKKKESVQKVPPPEKCSLCYTRFADKAKLERHQERMHSKPEVPQTCKICNKQLKNRKKFYHHMYLHKKKEQLYKQPELRAELHCAECDRDFDTPSAFRQHRLSVKHSGRDHWKYECDECGRVYATKYRVQQHIQVVHLKQLNYKCSVCPKRLPSSSRLRHHERSHGPQARPHVCHLCGKTYTIKKSLREHLLAHAGLRPHVCKLCPATFTYSAALFTHHRLKHLKVKMTWKKRRNTKKDAPTDNKEGKGAPTDKKEGKAAPTDKKEGKASRKKKTKKKDAAHDQCVK